MHACMPYRRVMTPFTVGSYSESGGVCKTTHAVSLAMVAAAAGLDVLLVDLDPRAAASRWLNVDPIEPGLDVSAIIGGDDVDGWADQLAVPAGDGWHSRLRVIPASRRLATLEAQIAQGVELRLLRALDGCRADLVVLDCSNRQGGPLTLNALYAADGLLIAARPDADGREGVEGALTTIERHRANLARLGSTRTLDVLGIVVGNARDTVVPRIERHTLTALAEAYGPKLLSPAIPSRTIVREARETGQWYGTYDTGAVVVDAYAAIAGQVLPLTPTPTAKEPVTA